MSVYSPADNPVMVKSSAPVPPSKSKNTDPSLPPKHDVLSGYAVTCNPAAGSVISNSIINGHPLASIMVSVYNPADRSAGSSYVYGSVPPVTVYTTAPSDPSKQDTLVVSEINTVRASLGSVISNSIINGHPLASIIVSE